MITKELEDPGSDAVRCDQTLSAEPVGQKRTWMEGTARVDFDFMVNCRRVA